MRNRDAGQTALLDCIIEQIARHRTLRMTQLMELIDPGNRQYLNRHLLRLSHGSRPGAKDPIKGLGLIAAVHRARETTSWTGRDNLYYLTPKGYAYARQMHELAGVRLKEMDEQKARNTHTIETNSTGLTFARAADAYRGSATWENEVGTQFRPVQANRWAEGVVFSDAKVTIELPRSSSAIPLTIELLIECDRSTMQYKPLVDKVRRYLEARSYTVRRKSDSPNETPLPLWTTQYNYSPGEPYQGFPTVVFVFTSSATVRKPDGVNAAASRDAFAEVLRIKKDTDPAFAALNEADHRAGVEVLLTTLDDLTGTEGGPSNALEPVLLDPFTREFVSLTGVTRPAEAHNVERSPVCTA